MKQDNFTWIWQHLSTRPASCWGRTSLPRRKPAVAGGARVQRGRSRCADRGAARRQERRLVRDVTDAMMTNESFFFRDGKPFDQFKTVVLPRLLSRARAQKTIRIWSAAASTGQEPYTLAMICKEEAAKLAGWRIEIVGTDLSRDVLDRAKRGAYSQFEVQRGLPIPMLVRHFKQDGDRG